jgi:asparagine synthase (glutamine-hydrolysing)
MGAIAAHLQFAGHPDTERVRRMLELTPYRGDIRQVLVHGACAIGMSRHLDWPDASLASDGAYAAAMYGSIDNLGELGAELSQAAPNLDDDPARMLIAAFRVYGEQVVSHLRGDFGAIVTDGRSIWCFRDHIGYSPLYYRSEAAGAFVAVEAKQIVAGSGIRPEPDIEVFESTFYSSIVDETRCPLRGVSRVPQRKVTVISEGRVRSTLYWLPESILESARLSPTDIKDRFEQLMTQAVSRMMTDRTIVSLSGGIDSSAIAAFAAPVSLQKTGRPLAAISAVYPQYPTTDERRYVELIAAKLGIVLTVYQPHYRALDSLEKWVRSCDSPMIAESLAGAWEFFGEVRNLGARTVFSGDNAEFVFDMGQRYLLPHFLFRRRLGAVRRHLAAQRRRGASVTAIGRQLFKTLVPDGLLDARARAQYRPRLPDWVDYRRMERLATPLPPKRDRWRHWQVANLSYPNLAAETEGIVEAMSGVTVRRPWSDVDLWEFFLSLPAETKFPDVSPRKLFVRRLLRGRVPDEILTRVKGYYDEVALGTIDYSLLQRLLSLPDYRMPGVDYQRLAERLRRQDLGLEDIPFAYGLASIHAFVDQLARGQGMTAAVAVTA